MSSFGCGSGGSEGPTSPSGNPDVLSITYCRVVDINHEMHVQWSASHPTTGEFRYGTSRLTDTIADSVLADSHDVVLIGLDHATHYLFELTVRDSAEHSIHYPGSFTTPARTSLAPVINGLEISEITESTALISWRTDVPATTLLYYGLSSLTDSVTADSLSFLHKIRLSSLNPSATYHMQPQAVDSAGRRGMGSDTSLVTAAPMNLVFPDAVIALGDTVRLPVTISGAQDLAALHLALSFLPGSIELLDIEQGPFYSDHQGFMFFSDIQNSTGRVRTDLTWNILYQNGQRTGTDADGSGIVVYAVLRGLTTGNPQLHFVSDSSLALDMYSLPHVLDLHAGIVMVTP